jgi:hypothetical protein
VRKGLFEGSRVMCWLSQGTIRLQWDPDHLPNGRPHHARRAVQLGMKTLAPLVTPCPNALASGEDILRIEDISEFVHEQGARVKQLKPKTEGSLVVARERIYRPDSAAARAALNISEP